MRFSALFFLLAIATPANTRASDSTATRSALADSVRPQYGRITGCITDTAGNPLVGATVLVEGAAKGGYSRANGVFTIAKVPVGQYTLHARSLGFKTGIATITVPLQDSVTVNFVLIPDEKIVDLDDWGCGYLINPYMVGTIRTLYNYELQHTPP